MDDAVCRRGAAAQAVEVVEGAAVDLGPGGHRRGGVVRAGQADDLVSGVEELADDGRTDESGRAGDKYTHGDPSRFDWRLATVSARMD